MSLSFSDGLLNTIRWQDLAGDSQEGLLDWLRESLHRLKIKGFPLIGLMYNEYALFLSNKCNYITRYLLCLWVIKNLKLCSTALMHLSLVYSFIQIFIKYLLYVRHRAGIQPNKSYKDTTEQDQLLAPVELAF